MSENLRAIVAVLFFTVPTLLLLRKPVTQQLMSWMDYNRRAGLWVFITASLFLAHNFWLFMALTTLAILIVGRRDSNPLALYAFLFLAAPPFHSAIAGFGGINYFISLDYLRLLSFVMLLPLALKLLLEPSTPGLLRLPTDKYVLGYILLFLGLLAPHTSFTDLLRTMLLHVIDVFLPYYVFSRSVRSLADLREIAAGFVVGCALLAVIALFESVKGWLLYSSLPSVLNVQWGYGHYMLRDGALRATASAGHSIVLGYLLTVSLGLHLMLRTSFGSVNVWRSVLVALCLGVLATLSRGPWVGAFAVALIALTTGPGTGKRLGTLALASVPISALLMISPLGSKIVGLIPFIGNVDVDTITYRQQLFEGSWLVVMQNPFLGSPYFAQTDVMQSLRQGEGIIDLVNTYIAVALASGFVGLAIFCGGFVSCLIRLFRHLWLHPAKGGPDYTAAKSLFASLVAIVLIIATASSINAIPVVYWLMIGLSAGYLRLVVAAPLASMVQPPPLQPARHTPSF